MDIDDDDDDDDDDVMLTCADDYTKYAHSLIADYLPTDVSKQLATSLGSVFLSLSQSLCLPAVSLSACMSVYLYLSVYLHVCLSDIVSVSLSC